MNLKRFLKLTAFILAPLVGLWFYIGYYSACTLTATRHVTFDDIQKFDKHSVTPLNLTARDGIAISAWLVDQPSDKAIILLSGIKGNRLAQEKRTKFYLKKGFTVLLPDLRGTGKSGGDCISFGWNEQYDLIACVEELQHRGIQHVAADGLSLGAATILYAHSQLTNFDFVVIESSYDNIENAFQNRMRQYPIPSFAYYPLRLFTSLKIHTDLKNLSPDQWIKNVRCPTLILAGDSEAQIKVSETQKLYENCGSSKKYLHLFKGGHHEDFIDRFEAEYTKEISRFLTENGR